MADTREQIIERMARAEWDTYWPGDPFGDADEGTKSEFRASVSAGLPIAVKAVTDAMRAEHRIDRVREWCNGCCARVFTGYQCRTLDLCDQIDAEMGVQR